MDLRTQPDRSQCLQSVLRKAWTAEDRVESAEGTMFSKGSERLAIRRVGLVVLKASFGLSTNNMSTELHSGGQAQTA